MRNYLSVYLHLVWATWDRLPLITEDFERRLYRFVNAICREHECDVLAIGGMPDHIHLLIKMSPKICISDLMEYVKGGSSRFISGETSEDHWFKWQRGYGAFSVSASHKKRVITYIENQKEHHASGNTWDHAEPIHIDDAPAQVGARTEAP